jgi:hypothetical protein
MVGRKQHQKNREYLPHAAPEMLVSSIQRDTENQQPFAAQVTADDQSE